MGEENNEETHLLLPNSTKLPSSSISSLHPERTGAFSCFSFDFSHSSHLISTYVHVYLIIWISILILLNNDLACLNLFIIKGTYGLLWHI